MSDKSEQENWAGLAQGDADTWRKILSRMIPQLYQMFMRRWPNPALAEELVQKTVFDAVRGREGFDRTKGSVEQWLIAIAKNNLALEMRRRANRPAINGDIAGYLEVIDSEPLPDEVIEKQETAAIIRKAMESLESKARKVLRAKYIESLSARQIGRQMGITEKAVHSLLYRARISLREKLNKMAGLDKECRYEK